MTNWGNTYQTQTIEVMTPYGWIRHLIIKRHDGKSIKVSWDVLQEIKNDVLGEDALAVEIFPASSEVADEANWRHLWEMPAGIFLLPLFERSKR